MSPSEQETDSLREVLEFPREPYPGLRPFLRREAALLYGRTKPVALVLERLAERQFVAVIGGSGSGKSSLVLAGVVPGLRSYGIPRAGDFWVPMICTPGTNAAEVEGGGPAQTPLRRLAWKFAQLLRPLATPDKAHQRVEQIAELLRQDAGFGQLIDAYSPQLATSSGLSGQDARFLFVIDQFEELFHPTNRDADGEMLPDVKLLVERVIDHFFCPHERCYVVLTMRSEHLNDCAAFLQLPDAINAASYLVRRLDDDQLREAITEPARSYLRVREREEREGDVLPPDICFEPAVVDRLLDDVRDIAHDPDHLPLLQHALSRTWDVAMARCGADRLPALIDADDLARAVLADADATGSQLGAGNVLRTCLVNHADQLVRPLDATVRAELDAMLEDLAFKDPNTGLYSQQRINIDAGNQDHLKSLVQHGLVGKVNYLFWDDEDKEHVTLKVSHESFIRGWPYFRALIDRKAERFEEFMLALRACAKWRRLGSQPDGLLDGAQLRNLQAANLQPVLDAPAQRRDWFKYLAYVHDGRRYTELEPLIQGFVADSVARDKQQRKQAEEIEHRAREAEISMATMRADREASEQRQAAERAREEQARLGLELGAREALLQAAEAQAQAAEAQAQAATAQAQAAEALAKNARNELLVRKKNLLALRVFSFVFLLLPLVLFWALVEMPVRNRVDDLLKAWKQLYGINAPFAGPVFEPAKAQLAQALKAAQSLGRGLSGSVGRLDFEPPFWVEARLWGTRWAVDARRQSLEDFRNIVEPQFNGSLRQLLTMVPWPAQGANYPQAVGQPFFCGLVQEGAGAAAADPAASVAVAAPPKGTLYGFAAGPQGPARWLYVSPAEAGDPGASWEIRPAVVTLKAGTPDGCRAGLLLWRSPPADSRPAVAFDSGLNYLFQLIFRPGAPAGSPGTLVVEPLTWAGDTVSRGQPTVIQDGEVAAAVERKLPALPKADAEGGPRHAVLLSVPADGGTVVQVANDRHWRLVSAAPSRVPAAEFATVLAMRAAEPTSSEVCDRIGRRLRDSASGGPVTVDQIELAQQGGHCFVVQRGHSSQGLTPVGMDVIQLSVYLASAADDPELRPVASVSFDLQPAGVLRWYQGSNRFAGWVALGVNVAPGEAPRLIGLPWSTAAMVSLAQSVSDGAPALVGAASAPGRPPSR